MRGAGERRMQFRREFMCAFTCHETVFEKRNAHNFPFACVLWQIVDVHDSEYTVREFNLCNRKWNTFAAPAAIRARNSTNSNIFRLSENVR